MDFRRIKQVFQYGWKDAKEISKEGGIHKSRLSIFFDILHCFMKYNLWSNQYKKEKLYSLKGNARKEICLKYQEKNVKRDNWVKEFFENYKFLNKWSSFKYEKSAILQSKRIAAYKKRYHLGDNCFVGYGVIFHKHHYCDSEIECGKDCGFSEHVDIDYTGGLKIGYKVWISEGAKVFTHNHKADFKDHGTNKGCICTPLIIHDRVWIGARAMIMPNVVEIGRGALIGANTCISKKVPPYAIVMGNPAKIVGFRKTLEEIIEFEQNNYPEEERISTDILKRNYEFYFKSRWQEIKKWNKL